MNASGAAKSGEWEYSVALARESKIVGQGEMADQIRKHNWSATPLGPIAGWSSELVTMVNLTLAMPDAAELLWGPKLILIFNDAYRRIPGKRHPEALGRPARDAYGEPWRVVGPRLEEAFAEGAAFSHDKLRTPIETPEGLKDFYLNYSHSPVIENGRVAGLFGLIHDVTEDVTSASNQRTNEMRARRVLQSIADAVIVTDAGTRILQMNRAAESLTGWQLVEAANRPLDEVFRIVDERTRRPVENPAERAVRAGATVAPANHLVLERRAGSDTAIGASAGPIFDDHGEVAGAVLVFRDLGERRAAERERADLANQFSLVLDATTDGVLSVDRQWRMIYGNRRAQEMLAATGELTGRLLWDTFPEAVYEGSPFIEHFYAAMDSGVPGKFEAYYPGPLHAWFTIDAQPAEHGIVIFFHDITAQRQEAEALKENAARLKAIYATSLEYIGLITADGLVIDCNRASLEFGPIRKEDVVGKHFAETPWFATSPGAPELVREAIGIARAGETFRREMALTRPDGETLMFDFSLTPVRDESGKVVLLVPESRDITEVKRAESALLQSEKLAAVGRLASSIAHEINNPLESVMNLIYLARNAETDGAHNYLELADQEIRRVSIIANQTLRFHKQASNPQAATSTDLFSTVMSIYEGRLHNARVQVEKKFRSDDPVICFQGDVRQVLNNLVSNALEAMPFGGRLLIRSRKGRNWRSGMGGLVLTIADNGTGMTRAVQKHIFDAFFTTKGTAGNGLGLWVCKEIVERHHGTLLVRSCQRAGRNGTTFALFLPFNAKCD